MKKFENMNILAALDTIMQVHTKHYQNDFDTDRKIILRAAQSENPEDKRLLWMSRPAGTWCFKEQDVFVKDSPPYNAWVFYGEQTQDRILAYAVEIDGIKDGKVRGTLYELDYSKHFQYVRNNALPVGRLVITFEDGSGIELPHSAGLRFPPQEKPVLSARYEPVDLSAWRSLLQNEQGARKQAARAGNYLTHISALEKAESKASVTEKLAEAKRSVKPPNTDKPSAKAGPER